VLDVAIPKNTKVLEIHATLADPRKAHALASYIANHTIELNRKTSRAGDQEFIEHTSRELKAATERAAAAETAYTSALKNAPMPEATQSELHRLGERRAEVARLALSAELSVADLQDRAKALAAAGRSGTEELELLNERIRSTGNRAQTLRAELRSLDDQVRQREKLLAGRKASVDVLAAEYEAARSIREEAAKRLRDAQASAEYRGERINLLDPGIVPERPSSPNLPLNLTVAVALGLLVSLAYLTIEFVMQSQQVEVARKLPRVVGKS
jgi:uncharacterized protein involved in exopolysaccharide biosynthesis